MKVYVDESIFSCLKNMRISCFGVQFGRDWFLATEASSLRTSIQEQLTRLFDQEIHACEQVNQESVSNGRDAGVCEVVIPLEGDAACKSSITFYMCALMLFLFKMLSWKLMYTYVSPTHLLSAFEFDERV